MEVEKREIETNSSGFLDSQAFLDIEVSNPEQGASDLNERKKKKMIRNIKKLGLAMVAVLAMSALVASAAQAGKVDVPSTATLHGSQVEGSHTFTLTDNSNLTTKCTTATCTAVGTVADGAETIEIHPEYSGCTAFGIASTTITTTGCNYLFHIGANTSGTFDGTVDVNCGSGSIVISNALCEVKVDTQSGLYGGKLTNCVAGSGKHYTSKNTAGALVTLCRTKFKPFVTTSSHSQLLH